MKKKETPYKFKNSYIEFLSEDCFRVAIKGQSKAEYLTEKQFQSLKETFRDWLNKEGYKGE